MDFGEATFTSFEGGQGWMDCFKRYPQVDMFKPQPGWYVGKVHSHHTMTSYHSSTDNTDLYDTAPKLPMFLSLVVNYACEIDCKLAIAYDIEETVVTETKWRLKGWKDFKKESKTVTAKPTTTLVIDCETRYEQEEWMTKVIDELKKPKNVPASAYGQQSSIGFDWQSRINQNKASKEPLPPSTPHIYAPMINRINDLITLGEGDGLAPAIALSKANIAVEAAKAAEYKKAFKLYFATVWVDETYPNRAVLVEDIIIAVRQFLAYHKDVWLVNHISQALDELKEEYYPLRKVQGSALV